MHIRFRKGVLHCTQDKKGMAYPSPTDEVHRMARYVRVYIRAKGRSEQCAFRPHHSNDHVPVGRQACLGFQCDFISPQQTKH